MDICSKYKRINVCDKIKDIREKTDDSSILLLLPVSIRDSFEKFISIDKLEEIRIRVNQCISIYSRYGEEILPKECEYIMTKSDIREIVEYISGYSLYAYEEELKDGYITVRGGHRVGIAGKVVVDNGRIKNISNISSINIRVCHEIPGISNSLSQYIYDGSIHNTLIISPPGVGKTTMLRDIVKLCSDEYKYKVSVIDERSEIAACYMGVPCNYIGKRTDVLDGCPKAEGIILAIRSLSPDILAVDEIGGSKDIEGLLHAFNCGVHVFATVHGRNMDELKGKEYMKEILTNKRFTRYVVLGKSKGDRWLEVYNEDMKRIDVA